MMNTLRKRMLTGLAVLYIGAGALTAHAQAPAAGNPPNQQERGDHAQMAARMKERIAKRQAELHDKLKLSPGQEGAWNTYIGRMQPADRPQRPDRDAMQKLSVPERMDQMMAMLKQHEQQLAERTAATKEFYAQLTPEQQKVFNAEFGKGWGHRHGKHHDEGMSQQK
jgi:periplasmic protein CpxP/Spy